MPVWGGMHGGVGWSYFHGELNQSHWDEYLAQLQSFVSEDYQQLSLILLSRQSGNPTAAMRKELGEFMRGQQHLMQRVNANAMVFDSPLARGALTAINWLFRKPFPERVFKNTNDAIEWLAQIDANVEGDALLEGMRQTVPKVRLIL